MANTISTDLQRQTVLLEQAVRAFANRLLPLRAFATAFYNVPLQGTDEVVVPYYPLQTAASTDWDASKGYEFGNTNSQGKKITVNKRKYQALDFESAEVRRQPAFSVDRLVTMNAEKLATDVMADILSVVTEVNFGAPAYSGPPAAFASDNVANLRKIANDLNWPDGGRALIVNTDLDAALCKDPDVKLALNIGGTEVIRDGKVPRLLGFDYLHSTSIPSNGEGLMGMIAAPSSVLVAFAPVEPTQDVRQQLNTYQVVTDTLTGISLTYKRWGNPDLDRGRAVIECSYGYAVGETTALRRIRNNV